MWSLTLMKYVADIEQQRLIRDSQGEEEENYDFIILWQINL